MLEKYKFDDGWFLNVTNSPVDIAYCVIGANEFRFLTKKESRSAGPALEMSVENRRIAGPFPSLADVEGHRKFMLNMKDANKEVLPPVENPPEEPPVENPPEVAPVEPPPAEEVPPAVVDGQQQPEDVGNDQSPEEVADDVKKSSKRKGK